MKKEVPRENVAQFYFPGGKPISKEQKQKNEQAIEKAYKEDSLTLADFEPAGTKCIAFPDPKFVNM